MSGNFIVDRHPELDNVWIAGGGNAEGMGPVIGEYIARRVLRLPTDPALDEQFKLAPGTFEAWPPREADDELLLELADARSREANASDARSSARARGIRSWHEAHGSRSATRDPG